MNAPTPDVHDPASAHDNRLVVAISSRALFDLGDSHALFERDGLDAYRSFQIEHENEILQAWRGVSAGAETARTSTSWPVMCRRSR